jgi:DNA-binding transcriptional MerR regulator
VADVEIPDKLYFKIGEVADIVGVEAFVLRFWESEFSTLSPKKSESGHRVYRRTDLDMALKIRSLLHEQGFTIAGARKQLGRRGRNAADEKVGKKTAKKLKQVRDELQDILTLLDGKS